MSNSGNLSSFLEKVTSIIEDQISNEQFGVSELADAVHMSRSNLLRKIKKETGQSASQYIRSLRLKKAKELLKETEMTVSEISFEVGFSNSSYFIKCYREEFGHPPGESRNMPDEPEVEEVAISIESSKPTEENFLLKNRNTFIVALTAVIISFIFLFWPSKTDDIPKDAIAKSIAVLPFKNMSADSTNYYFVNGLMEASLYNLQKIGELRVVSRTSVERYRHSNSGVGVIANELNVKYVVEGSGQKINDEILLNIQLIDADSDTPIWTERYQYKLANIFTLQNTIAKQIALAVEANITPQELAQIDKKPTEDLEAYDFYLKGVDLVWRRDDQSLMAAIEKFKAATEKDPQYASAYAQMAIAYYFLDEFKPEKSHLEDLNRSADNALLYDSKSDLSLIAKALYYIATKEFNLAIPHLEKALEYNPNSSSVILILSEMYARVVPDTTKYLTYALKGLQLEKNANDSIAQSFLYLHLSNALVQSGFPKESLEYINTSLSWYPGNEFAPYLKGFITYANDLDMDQLIQTLEYEWKKDTTRMDITQELGKIYYFKEDYETSYYYFKRFKQLQQGKVDLYPWENLKIGIVFEKMGEKEKAEELYKSYYERCQVDKTIYQPGSMAMYYIHQNKMDEAIAQFQLFSKGQNFHYWMILFLEDDPLLKKLKTHPRYQQTIDAIKAQFLKQHNRLKATLEEENLL